MKDKRDYCKKHIGHSIHPKYGKCFLCRIEDGDIVRCEKHGQYYDPKKYLQCYKCACPKVEEDK